jgi:hypothetical protein
VVYCSFIWPLPPSTHTGTMIIYSGKVLDVGRPRGVYIALASHGTASTAASSAKRWVGRSNPMGGTSVWMVIAMPMRLRSALKSCRR